MKITVEVTENNQMFDMLMKPHIKLEVISQIERAIHQWLNMREGNTVVDLDLNTNVKVTVQD